jgi:hypothetical protein
MLQLQLIDLPLQPSHLFRTRVPHSLIHILKRQNNCRKQQGKCRSKQNGHRVHVGKMSTARHNVNATHFLS